jgi:hypothetical protein
MKVSLKPLPFKIKSGETPSDLARRFNETLLALEDRDGRLAEMGMAIDNLRAEAKRAGGGTGKVSQFVVVAVHEDYLTCRSLSIGDDGARTEGTTDIDVAKPYELRRSTWLDQTIGYRSYAVYTGVEFIGSEEDGTDEQIRMMTTSDGATEDEAVEEYVDPAYISRVQETVEEVTTTIVEGSVILAAKVTGTVTVLEEVESALVWTKDCSWVDVNSDGRHWDLKYRDVTVCVAGESKRMRLRASAAFDPPS